MTLYLPVGPPGSGKSWLANVLVKHKLIVQDAIVSTDRYRQIMTGHSNDQSVNDAAWQIARTIAHERIERGLTVYFDATNINPDWYDKLLAKAQANDHRILFILFDTSSEVCRARNLDRGDSAIPDTSVERMIREHAAIKPEDLEGDVIRGSSEGGYGSAEILLTGLKTWLEGTP